MAGNIGFEVHMDEDFDPALGLLLPCNVTVEAALDGGSIVRIVNPEVRVKIGNIEDNPEIVEVASQPRLRLERVASSLIDQ